MAKMSEKLTARETAEAIKDALCKHYSSVHLIEMSPSEVTSNEPIPPWFGASDYLGNLYVEFNRFVLAVRMRTDVVEMVYVLPGSTCYDTVPEDWARLGLQRSVQCQTARSSPAAIAGYARRALIAPIVSAKGTIERVLGDALQRERELSAFLSAIPPRVLGRKDGNWEAAACTLGNFSASTGGDGVQRVSGTFSNCPLPLLRAITDVIDGYVPPDAIDCT